MKSSSVKKAAGAALLAAYLAAGALLSFQLVRRTLVLFNMESGTMTAWLCFALPVILLLLPLMLRIVLKRPLLVIVPFCAVIFAAYLFFWRGAAIKAEAPFRSFTPELWKTCPDARYLMIDDLKEQGLIGMEREELIKKLGRGANSDSDSTWSYFIRYDLRTGEYLELSFKDARVTDFRIRKGD